MIGRVQLTSAEESLVPGIPFGAVCAGCAAAPALRDVVDRAVAEHPTRLDSTSI